MIYSTNQAEKEEEKKLNERTKTVSNLGLILDLLISCSNVYIIMVAKWIIRGFVYIRHEKNEKL